MEKMLEVDSDKRINAAQTLQHPYLEEVCTPMILKDIFIKKINFSMLTLQMNQQRHSMIRPLKTMISLLMFGRVRVTFSL